MLSSLNFSETFRQITQQRDTVQLDLRLGNVVYLLIFYNITNSWLLSSAGFDFNILWRDSENREYILIREPWEPYQGR